MPLPTMTGVGRVVADPELRFTQNGTPVAKIRLVFQNRRLNSQTQQWEDGDTLWIDGTAWQQLAEHITETLTQGMEVLVTGEPRTETWEKDGQKHSRVSLTIRSIGPSLAYATAKVQKAQGGGQRQQPQRPQQARQQAQNDPWATSTDPGVEPPF
ncbi:single-stranded DNA-binding protein [Kitasatospora sp. NPDC018619]|uniref:single-stranded DNA-binding protein n=1 Tax=unclassified Kitasatospora TaxID=2633591 RepID=UPI0037ACFE86